MLNTRNRRTGLRCERLENRDCPAVFFRGGILIVTGTSAADTVEITDEGDGTVTAVLNGESVTEENVRAVAVYTGAGDDTIDYTVTGDQTRRLRVAVYAGAGDDAVTLDAGDVTGRFAFAAFGASGDDTLAATVGGVAAGGVAAVTLNGGRGNDTVSADAAGEIDGYLAVTLTGSFGTDTVEGTIDAAAGSTGRVAALVSGGLGNDTLALNVTGDGAEDIRLLRAILHGGPGTDTGDATDNVRQISVES